MSDRTEANAETGDPSTHEQDCKKTGLERAKLFSDMISAWIGVLAIAIGGIFAAYQYLEKEASDRTKATFDMLERFGKAPLFDARRKVENAWLRHSAELAVVVNAPSAEPQSLESLVLKVSHDESIAGDVYVLISFFETIEI